MISESGLKTMARLEVVPWSMDKMQLLMVNAVSSQFGFGWLALFFLLNGLV